MAYKEPEVKGTEESEAKRNLQAKADKAKAEGAKTEGAEAKAEGAEATEEEA